MKKTMAVTAIGATLALAGSALPAGAAAMKEVITDPVGDANFVNDQGTGDGSVGDQTAADAGTVSDILSVSLGNDSKKLYVYFETEAAPPATTGIGYRLRTNPDAAGTHCLVFEAYFPGANNALTAAEAYFKDVCAGGEAKPIEVLGTQLAIPRKLSKALGKGKKLTAPQAQAFLYSGTSYPAGATAPVADTTLVGKDYKLVDKKKKK